MSQRRENGVFTTPPTLANHLDKMARQFLEDPTAYEKLKGIHFGHIDGEVDALKRLKLPLGLPHGFREELVVTDLKSGHRHLVEQVHEIISRFSNDSILQLIKEGGVSVSDQQLHQFFPSSRSEYRISTTNETHRIRQSAQQLGFALPKDLEAFKPPVDDNPGLVVMAELQNIIAGKNHEVRKAGPVGKGNDIALAWIKGGSMPHFARILFGKVFHYPSLTLHHIADQLQHTTDMKRHTLDAARQFAAFFYSEILGDPDISRRYNPYKKPLPQLKGDVGKYSTADHPLLSGLARAFIRKLDEYDDSLSYDLIRASAMGSALRTNNLSSYHSDLDVVLALPPSEAFKAASRIAHKLQESGFTIRTNSRHGAIDPHLLLYEIFIQRADGTEQVFEFHINPNHPVHSSSEAQMDNTSLAVDIAYEMTAYQSMRLVMDGESLHFYDPYNVVAHRGQRICVSPLFGYLSPPQIVAAPFYISSYQALSATPELNPWDLDFIRRRVAYTSDIILGSHPDENDIIPYANKFLLYAIHNAQKALRADQAVGLYDAKDMNPGSIYDRFIALWEEIGMFDLINLICRQKNIAQETLAELVKAFPQQVKVNFPAPDETSCEKYAKSSITEARMSASPYNPTTQPEQIGENIGDYIEA